MEIKKNNNLFLNKEVFPKLLSNYIYFKHNNLAKNTFFVVENAEQNLRLKIVNTFFNKEKIVLRAYICWKVIRGYTFISLSVNFDTFFNQW